MKHLIQLSICLVIISLFSLSLDGQTETNKQSSTPTDLSDRQAIIKAVEDFYIGDHTGSIEHKKRSMHEKGAYRSVNRDGDYGEYLFPINSNDADTSFKEELQSIEIYENVALARIRQQNIENGGVHYKLMLLHKVKGNWIITTISWGSKITQ